MTGFVDAIRTDIRIPLGETITVPMTLTVTATASVEVDTTPPLLDVENAKAGITVNQRILANLPLGRNYASVAALVPGTGRDVLGPTFYGASSLENSYQVDGINTTGIKVGGQGKQVPLEFIQEMEIRSGGYEAEFGKALGGHFNVLTKTGGGEIRGEVFGYYDSDALGASDEHETDRALVGAPALERPERLELGVTIGGPLVRDRIWFFGAYARARKEQGYSAVNQITFSPSGGSVPQYEDRKDTERADLFAVNLSWMPSPSHSLSVSIFGDPSDSVGRTWENPTPGPASANVTEKRTGGTDISARWTGFLGRFITEFQYGYHTEGYRENNDFSNVPAIGEVRGNVLQLLQGSGPYPNHLGDFAGKLVDETYRRNSFHASTSLNLGTHDVKAGGVFELENPNRTARFSGTETIWNYYLSDGTYDYSLHRYLAATPLNCTRRTDGQTGDFGYIPYWECFAWEKADQVRSDFRSRNISFYIQDAWRPRPNLTVKAGLRYDSQELRDANGAVALRLSNQWSPRISVSWDPSKNGRTKVFGSYGRYYQAIPQFLQSRMLSGEVPAVVANASSGIDPVGTYDYAFIQEPWYLPSDLKGMYQDEISGGVELVLGASWHVGVRGVYRALGRAIDDRCDRADPGQGLDPHFPEGFHGECAIVNLGEGELGQFRDSANPACFEDFPANTRPAPCESVQARRFYRGVEIGIDHRPSPDLYLQASYVLSRLSGNYDGVVAHRPNGSQQADPGTSVAFDYAPMLVDNFGRLPSDRTHQVKVSGSYTLPFGLTAGVVAQFWSGLPLSVYGQVPTTVGFYVPAFLTQRGSEGEMPSTYNVDLHIHHGLHIGSVTITPTLDIFNLTNVQRGLSRYQRYNTRPTSSNNQPPFTSPTDPRFGKDVSWQTPRLIRLGLKVAY
ncbi:MAG: TonB-dependent receptor [Acidobacteria bacterium]|nr:TonB-dependent receptor [Acidobacteriota bacterium]